MRKDGANGNGGGVFAGTVGSFGGPAFHHKHCLDVKPFVATLVVLTLLMAVWQLQPYENLLAPRPCPLPTTTTIVTTVNSSSSSSSSAALKATVGPREKQLQQQPEQKLTSASLMSVPSSSSSSRPTRPRDPNKRVFQPYGNAAALFVHMATYRGGPNTFATVGLASKPIHVFGKPWYKCEWVPNNPNATSVRTTGYKMLPDWGYGRVYTVVVVNCTFKANPNADNSGGQLYVKAYYSHKSQRYERILALEEAPGAYDESKFSPPFKYDYLYCGSSLYGSLSSERIREWMAYHAHFFGPRSHFVFHDAGGVSPQVRAVLEPWVKAGRATVQDIRGQAEYDGYYYNQFLIVNDCLHRYRHAANWTFYFDVDEYIWLPDGNTLESVLNDFSDYTQFTIEQNPMSSKLCLDKPGRNYSSEWGFEKLVFRDSITGIRRDRKYAIQAKNAFATGVHMSENVVGKTLHKTESKIRYYHYHNSINVVGEPCREFLPASAKANVTWFEKTPYVYDDSMKKVAGAIKRFEEQTIGRFRNS